MEDERDYLGVLPYSPPDYGLDPYGDPEYQPDDGEQDDHDPQDHVHMSKTMGLAQLARRVGVSAKDLALANPQLADYNSIPAGTVVNLP